MAKHVISCAKRHIIRDQYEPGGPTVEVDDDYPDRIWIDGEVLRVAQWEGRWGGPIPQPDGTVYESEPWIEADLPAENGAVIVVHFPHDQDSVLMLGRYREGSWYPLTERDDYLEAHAGCTGSNCLCTHGGTFDDAEDAVFLPDILATWRRIGSKPIEVRPSYKPRPNVDAAPVVSELDRVIRSGRTVTLDEYREMTR